MTDSEMVNFLIQLQQLGTGKKDLVDYNPLKDDTTGNAQAMALFKTFRLWEALRDGSLVIHDGKQVNRAIVQHIISTHTHRSVK